MGAEIAQTGGQRGHVWRDAEVWTGEHSRASTDD